MGAMSLLDIIDFFHLVDELCANVEEGPDKSSVTRLIGLFNKLIFGQLDMRACSVCVCVCVCVCVWMCVCVCVDVCVCGCVHVGVCVDVLSLIHI